MPTTLAFSAARVPIATEGNAVPADLLRLGNDIDSLLVLKATSESDRNAKYGNVPAGTLVSCAALRTVWMKTSSPPSAATWVVIAQIGDVVTTGIVTATGDWSISSQTGKIVGPQKRWINIVVTYSGPEINASSTGNVTDTLCCTLSPDWRPIAQGAPGFRGSSTSGFMAVNPSGTCLITDMHPNSTIPTGASIRFVTEHPTDS